MLRHKKKMATCVTIGKEKAESLLHILCVGLASLACPWVYWEVSMKPLGSQILSNFHHLSAITTQKFFSQWMTERKPQTHNSLQCCANPSFCEFPCKKIFPYFEWKISLHLIVLTSCSCYISPGIKFKQYLCDKQNYLYSLFYAHTKKRVFTISHTQNVCKLLPSFIIIVSLYWHLMAEKVDMLTVITIGW